MTQQDNLALQRIARSLESIDKHLEGLVKVAIGATVAWTEKKEEELTDVRGNLRAQLLRTERARANASPELQARFDEHIKMIKDALGEGG